MNCALRAHESALRVMNCPAGMNSAAALGGAIQIMERSEKSCAKRNSWRSQFIERESCTMPDNPLVTLSKSFAVNMIKLCDLIRSRGKATAIVSQMLRSGTSIGANIHEANYASSKADFISKFQIALKECYETDYWLEVFRDAGIITDEEYETAFVQCSKIRKLLIASITTAKRNQGTE